MAANDNGRIGREVGLSSKQRARLAESLRVLRLLNSPVEVRSDRHETELRAILARIDRGEDLRQLAFGFALVALLFVVGCGDSFVSFSDVDAGGASAGGPSSGGGSSSTGGVSAGGSSSGGGSSSTAGAAGGRSSAGGSSGDAGITVPPQRTHDSGEDAGRAGPSGTPDSGDGASSCVRYEGAVFACSPGESTWFPCPEPPRGYAFAQETHVVCCP